MEASFARSILVNAPMAVVAIDHSGAIRSSNATADAFFGRSVTQETPLQIGDLVPGIDVEALTSTSGLVSFNARSRSGGDGVQTLAHRVGVADAFVDIQAAEFSVRGEDFLTLFIQDITTVVTAETVVQDLRLQITYNWRLNSLGEMASMVAHELNQPLSAILNFLDAAKTILGRPDGDQAKVLRFIGSAEGQAERASDVIRRLRSLMSRDTGFHVQAAMFDIVDEILPILKISARETDAQISVKVPRDCNARCDRVQVQQVIVNLVRNALDAPATGQRRRIVISGRQTAGGCWLQVDDNGPGVSGAVVPHLFDPMSSKKPGGMGLGLSICRTIVEAHGGSIAYLPASLGGASISFTLNDRNTDA